MWQKCAPDFKLRFLPVDRMVLCRPRKRKNNPEGLSLLSGMAEDHFYVTNMERIEAIGTERDLAGMPVMELPLEVYSAPSGSGFWQRGHVLIWVP